jgi:hypothetical protein
MAPSDPPPGDRVARAKPALEPLPVRLEGNRIVVTIRMTV